MSYDTVNPDFDSRIADWLEDDPVHAPDPVLETVLAALPSIQQRRASRAPWRFPVMNRFAPFGAAAVIAIVLIGGTVFLLRPGGDGVGTLPTASPSPSATPVPSPSPSASQTTGACGLITSDEAESRAGITGLGALPSGSGTGDETTCIYSDGGGNVVLRLTYTLAGGGSAFDAARTTPGTQIVEDLGDEAVFDPATSTLFVRKGDGLLAVFAGAFGQSPDRRQAIETAIAELAVDRMTSAQ
jgi:hypothetical protein